jgi:hypothetical protein
MKVQDAIRQQLGFWHGITDSMLGDCADVLHKTTPDSKANSIAVTYAHVVTSEDGIVHGMIEGKPTIFETGGWAAKTGVPAPPGGPGLTPEWAASIKMDLPAFQEYAKQVYAYTDAYLAALSDEELDRKMQGPLGETTVGWITSVLLATHYPGHAGEIAALKGVHGLKGLPF